MYKKSVFLVFMLILCFPMLLGAIEEAAEWEIEPTLNNMAEYEKPKLLFNDFGNGTYQSNYEAWLDNGYAGRSFVIRTYNQLRFDLFGLANEVVGKNNDLFQQIYIDEYFGLDAKYDFLSDVNSKRLDEYISKLEYVSLKMREKGKVLIFLTTPNKCDFKTNNLPELYRNIPVATVRGVDCLHRLLANKKINYIDGKAVINESSLQYPVFYNSGIHWSRTAEQIVSLRVLHEIEEKWGHKIKKFKLGEVESSSTPYWRDADIWDLLNLWQKPDEKYYKFHTETVEPKEYEAMKVLIQGGSFALGLREDFITNNLCESVNYIFYNQYVYDMYGNQTEILFENNPDEFYSDWSSLNIDSLINESNVFIIEMNEEHIYALNNGFVDLLYNYLRYGNTADTYIKNLDMSGNFELQSDYMQGFYPYEEDTEGRFAWIAKDASVELCNAEAFTNGMQIVLEIPDIYRNSRGVLRINLNGEQFCEMDLADSGIKIIEVYPKRAQTGLADDRLYVEFHCTDSFNPYNNKMSNDDRDLAVKIIYVGGKQ